MIADAVLSMLSLFPVIGLAALGGFLGQKSGVWNVSLEGVMSFGAFSGILAYHFLGQNLLISLLVGFALSSVFGLFLSLLCVYKSMDQIVVGFGIWFFSEGLAGVLYSVLLPSVRVTEVFSLQLFSLDPIFYLTLTAYVAVHVILKRTMMGLSVVASGENPKAADYAGVNVYKVRAICTTLGAAFAGMAGSYLSLVVLQGFTYSIVAGYGWAAFAMVLFGRWSATGTLLSSLFFTFMVGAQTRLQVAGMAILPPEFMVALPYFGVIATLAIAGILGRKSGMPVALGVNYERE